MLLIQILVLILCANGAPVLVQRWFPSSINQPVDLGYHFIDNKPLLGASKTWRGLMASLLLTPLCAFLIGISPLHGFIIACLAMSGDLISSFIKRRLNIPVSAMAIGLDQIPESLLPFIFVYFYYQLSLLQLVSGVILFILCELMLSMVLFKMGIRKRPY